MIDRVGRPHHWLQERLSLCFLACVALFVLCIPTVCAQDTQQIALARSLFEQGVAAADAEQWAEAADRFERAYGLKPTPGIAFNWASALIELRRLVEAGERLRGIMRDPSTTPELSAEAQAKLDLITPRIASLTVQVRGPTDGVSVTLDGNVMSQAAWGVGSPTDPGGHTIVLARGDEVLQQEAIVLADGEHRELELNVPALAVSEPVPVPLVPVESERRPERKPLYKSWVLWTVVGVVVVAGAVTTGLLLAKDDPSAPEPIRGDTDPAVLKW